jgi:rare lipoprotein A (peptidoglycan hydrolase)
MRHLLTALLGVALALACAFPSAAHEATEVYLASLSGTRLDAVRPGGGETCIASVFDEGSRLADGSRWSRARSRAEVLVAHRRHRLGSRVRITRLDNGAVITAPVRDRGPYIAGRCVDLSVAAASHLGFSGLVRVRVEAID